MNVWNKTDGMNKELPIYFPEILISAGVPSYSWLHQEERKSFGSLRTQGRNSEVSKVRRLFQRKTIALGKHPRGGILVKEGKHLRVSEGQVRRDSHLLRWAAICQEIHFSFLSILWNWFNQYFCSARNQCGKVNCYHSKVMEWGCHYFQLFEARQSPISLAPFLGNFYTKFYGICRSGGKSTQMPFYHKCHSFLYMIKINHIQFHRHFGFKESRKMVP